MTYRERKLRKEIADLRRRANAYFRQLADDCNQVERLENIEPAERRTWRMVKKRALLYAKQFE